MAESIKEEWDVPVIPMNVDNMTEIDMYKILREALYEFPVVEIKVNMPEWIAILDSKNELKQKYINQIKESITEVDKLRDVEKITSHFLNTEEIEKAYISNIDPKSGTLQHLVNFIIKLFQK